MTVSSRTLSKTGLSSSVPSAFTTPGLRKISWIGVILLSIVLLFNVGAAIALAAIIYGPDESYVTGEYRTLKQKEKKKKVKKKGKKTNGSVHQSSK